MPDERNYTITFRVGEDGTQYLRIRETGLKRNWSARRLALMFAGSWNLLKAGSQRALRFVSRRVNA